jgi:hypothetical protein
MLGLRETSGDWRSVSPMRGGVQLSASSEAAGLGFRDVGRFLFFHGGSFAGQLEAWAWGEVLDVVREVVRTRQRLAGVFALATGGQESGRSNEASEEPSPEGGFLRVQDSLVEFETLHLAVTPSSEKGQPGGNSPCGIIVIVIGIGKG